MYQVFVIGIFLHVYDEVACSINSGSPCIPIGIHLLGTRYQSVVVARTDVCVDNVSTVIIIIVVIVVTFGI